MHQQTKWNPAFSVGNRTLDEQHKKLLGICAALAECGEMQDYARISRFHDLLNELSKYTREHFVTEESILARYNYPGLEEQKAEHLAYLERLIGIIADATFGKYDIAEAACLMSEWWTHHILESDMEYKGVVPDDASWM